MDDGITSDNEESKEELTENQMSDFSLQAEALWSSLDRDVLSTLFSEDLFSEEDEPKSVHVSDEEDSSKEVSSTCIAKRLSIASIEVASHGSNA